MAAKLNRDVKKGDTFQPTLTYRNKISKEPVDLTGATVSGEIKKGNITVPFEVVMLAASEGKFRIVLSSDVTADLAVGKYAMAVRITFTDDSVKTLFEGQFVVYA